MLLRFPICKIYHDLRPVHLTNQDESVVPPDSGNDIETRLPIKVTIGRKSPDSGLRGYEQHGSGAMNIETCERLLKINTPTNLEGGRQHVEVRVTADPSFPGPLHTQHGWHARIRLRLEIDHLSWREIRRLSELSNFVDRPHTQRILVYENHFPLRGCPRFMEA